MSDLAFNNYCITCDKLCLQSSIYCCESCKSIDEQQATKISQQESQVSPLLTPTYHHFNDYTTEVIVKENDLDFEYFDLNYSVDSKVDYSKGVLSSTSHNYRKWLTLSS